MSKIKYPRRVVVTGLGAITPVGTTLAETWDSLLAGRSGAAEILTFPCGDGPGPAAETPLGEICLCWASLVRGARGRGVSRRAYAARLVAHGLLHLAGHRHSTAAEERRMERAERRLLLGHLGAREIERLFA